MTVMDTTRIGLPGQLAKPQTLQRVMCRLSQSDIDQLIVFVMAQKNGRVLDVEGPWNCLS